MPVTSLPIIAPSLGLRHIVVGEAVRMMELIAEPLTRRWLASHVYRNEEEAIAGMKFVISCYVEPGDPRGGSYVLAVDHLVWCRRGLVRHRRDSPTTRVRR